MISVGNTSSFVAHVSLQTDAYYLYWNIESGIVKYICPSFCWHHKNTDRIYSCSITRGLIWRWTRGLMDCFDISFHSKAFTIRDYTRMWIFKYCFEYSKEYLRIMNVAKEKVYATLSNAAILPKTRCLSCNSIYKKQPRTVYLATLR